MEDNLRGQFDKTYTKNDSFVRQLINPIYDFKINNNDFSDMIYIFTFIIWIYNTYILYNKYVDVKYNFKELLMEDLK